MRQVGGFGAPTRELQAWRDVRVIREIEHANRASRTWEVHVNEQPGVAKLTFDRVASVEPGLRIAAYVQDHTGVVTGRPIPARDGSVSIPVPQPGGRPWTLAVLEFVEGVPVASFTEETSYAAGQLLGRVHHALARDRTPAVPGQLLEWYRSVGDAEVSALLAEIDAHELTWGVVYGDPSPELICGPDGSLALIDWGTPSFGPLIYDLATWESHAAAFAAGDPLSAAAALRAGYLTTSPCGATELDAVPPLTGLWRWLTAGSR